jgi:hypothetical protein
MTFVDGTKRVGFAAAHTFLLVNAFDLDVSSKSAGDFMIRTIADGKFRLALLSRWDCRALCASSWIRAGVPAPHHRFRLFLGGFPPLIILIRLFFASICMYNPARLDFI